MTTAAAFVRDFQGAVRAGFTLLAVVTGEEARAREMIALACKGLPVVLWSATSGTTLKEALDRATTSFRILSSIVITSKTPVRRTRPVPRHFTQPSPVATMSSRVWPEAASASTSSPRRLI